MGCPKKKKMESKVLKITGGNLISKTHFFNVNFGAFFAKTPEI